MSNLLRLRTPLLVLFTAVCFAGMAGHSSPASANAGTLAVLQDNEQGEIDPEVQKWLDAVETVYDNRPIDGATALTILFLGSLIVDRIAAGMLFLVSLTSLIPGSTTDRSKSRQTSVVIYYAFAIFVATCLLVSFSQFQLFISLGFTGMDPYTDKLFTGLILVLGAERVAAWLKLPGSPSAESSGPVHVTGEMTLIESTPQEDSKSPDP